MKGFDASVVGRAAFQAGKESKTVFSKHQRLEIFVDPLTEHEREGFANTVSFIKDDGICEWWKVRFIGDGGAYPRKIRKDGLNVK